MISCIWLRKHVYYIRTKFIILVPRFFSGTRVWFWNWVCSSGTSLLFQYQVASSSIGLMFWCQVCNSSTSLLFWYQVCSFHIGLLFIYKVCSSSTKYIILVIDYCANDYMKCIIPKSWHLLFIIDTSVLVYHNSSILKSLYESFFGLWNASFYLFLLATRIIKLCSSYKVIHRNCT